MAKKPPNRDKLLLEKITESPEEFIKYSMKEWVAYSDTLDKTLNKEEVSPAELVGLRRTLENLLLSFNGFATDHAIEIGALGPRAGGISKAKKTKARNKRIIKLRGEGKTYHNISGILTSDAMASIFAEAKKKSLSDSEVDKRIDEEEGNRISPDAVRKVYERRSEK